MPTPFSVASPLLDVLLWFFAFLGIVFALLLGSCWAGMLYEYLYGRKQREKAMKEWKRQMGL